MAASSVSPSTTLIDQEPHARVQELLSRLSGVRQLKPGVWRARCPAHEDENPSLYITLAEDKILLYCHRGCAAKDVVRAVGFQLKDLFFDSFQHRQNRWKIVATYDYRDKNGRSLYQVVRLEPKGFLQRRPAPGGGWEYNLNGVRRVLYRLPELLAADPGETVFVVEGEKDVDRLYSLGLVATTNPGGAGKWRPEYSEFLRNRHVVIIPDNDAAGRDHAIRVAEALYGKAATLKILELPGLPSKGDVSDWLSAGHTAEELLKLSQEAEEWKPRSEWDGIITAAELASKDFPEPRWMVPGLVPEGLTLLAGKPKLGKSWLCLGLGVAVAMGGRALGKIPVGQGEVLYLALENTERRLKQRLRETLQGVSAPKTLHLATSWPRWANGGLERLEAWLEGHPKTRLIMLDTLARVRNRGGKATRLYDDDYAALEGLQALASRYRIGVVVVHHLRKADSDDPLDLVSGTTGLTGAADTLLVLRRTRGQADAELFITGRDIAEQEIALRWDSLTKQWLLLGEAEVYRLSKQRTEILEVLRDGGVMSPKEIAEALGKQAGSVRFLIMKLAQEGWVRPVGHGCYSLATRFTNNAATANSANTPNSDNVTPLEDSGEGTSAGEAGLRDTSSHTVSNVSSPPFLPNTDHAEGEEVVPF